MQRYTTSSLGTLFRGAARAVKAVRLRPVGWAAHVAHWRLVARTTLRPQAAQRLQPQLQYARINRYPAFRSGAVRPTIRIPPGHAVGLGTARNFSSGPAAKTAHNVPVVLRAFTHVFDDEHGKQLPTARRYVPYPPPRRQRERRRTGRMARRCSETSHTSLLADLAHFFPTRGPLILPPTPETLITHGVESTLSLPLAPGLDSLLAIPTPEVSYADAEVGSAVLSTLLPLGDAISLASARVLPLLARLENLGVLEERCYPRTKLQVEMLDGRPDILRVVFDSRSSDDVLSLLGALGREADEHGNAVTATWFVITEQCILPETEEHWERVPRSAQRQELAMPSLVMPELALPSDEIPSPMHSGHTTPSSILDSWDDNASFVLDLSAISSVSEWSGTEGESEWSASSLASVMDAADWQRRQEWAVPPSADDAAVLTEYPYDRALFVAPW